MGRWQYTPNRWKSLQKIADLRNSSLFSCSSSMGSITPTSKIYTHAAPQEVCISHMHCHFLEGNFLKFPIHHYSIHKCFTLVCKAVITVTCCVSGVQIFQFNTQQLIYAFYLHFKVPTMSCMQWCYITYWKELKKIMKRGSSPLILVWIIKYQTKASTSCNDNPQYNVWFYANQHPLLIWHIHPNETKLCYHTTHNRSISYQ
jgi:hypothetical protein